MGGKGKGKPGSVNRPKEPTPVPKQEESDLSGKAKGAAIAIPLKLQGPPPKLQAAAPTVIAKQPVISKLKAEASTVADQPKTKAEASAIVDQPKPKAEASTVVDQPKPKAEVSIIVDQPKAKADPIVKAEPPKAEGQPKSLLSLASIKGRLGFGPPSKPERPPPSIQTEAEALEDDEDAEMQAAIHESMKARHPLVHNLNLEPRVPPKQVVDVDQKEAELMAQFDRLMEESLRLESLPNPSLRDRSRLRSIDVVSRGVEKQLEEIQERRTSSSGVAKPQESVAPILIPSAATPPPRSGSTTEEVKMVSPPSGQPLTMEKLMSGIIAGNLEPPPKVTGSQEQPKALSAAIKAEHPQPKERQSVKQDRSVSPPRPTPPPVPAIEDRPTSRREASEEPPKERERTPRRESSHERRRRSPSPRRGPSQERRQQSPSPPRRLSHEERHPSPPSRERSQEKRRRRRTPTPPSHSRERRRRSLTPPSHRTEKEITPDSAKVRSKESRKAEKKVKKESKHRRKSELDEPKRDRAERQERSRSTRRPESPHVKEPQVIEASETDDPSAKEAHQLAIQDEPARARPRFDPTREHVAAKRIAEKRKVTVQAQREHQRHPSAEGPPDREEEKRMRRRVPPPPPATSTKQASSRYRPLAFARPPLRRGSVTESSFVPSEREPIRLRVRVEDTPPQRPMPKRVLATPIGSSAPPRLQTTSHRPTYGEYQGQSHVRDDRSYAQDWAGGWQGQREYSEQRHVRPTQDDYQRTEASRYQQERQEWGSSQRRAPSMGRREAASMPAWMEQRQSNQYYQDWGQQPPTTQERRQDPQQGHQQYSSQQATVAQYWPMQQQQVPALPEPVFPPGMHASGMPPPPGLGPNVQRTRQGVVSQSASIRYGSAASRQQSPYGSQQPQGSAVERQQSPYGQQPPSSGWWVLSTRLSIVTPSISLRGSVLTREKSCFHWTISPVTVHAWVNHGEL